MDTLVPRRPSDGERRDLLMQALNTLEQNIKTEIEDGYELDEIEVESLHKDLERVQYLKNEFTNAGRYQLDDIDAIYTINHHYIPPTVVRFKDGRKFCSSCRVFGYTGD